MWAGYLVQALRTIGYDAYGVDLTTTLGEKPAPHLVPIRVQTTRNASNSYRVVDRYELPFVDRSFAAVVSSSTLEHIQDKETFFSEIHRVLTSGGATVHVFPSRYYFPCDPHSNVPLVPMLWPHVPRWWFWLWAMLGVRNDYQQDKPWRTIVQGNADYCRDALSYWPLSRYDRLLTSIGFRNVRNQFEFSVRNSPGGFATLMRRPAMLAVARLLPIVQQLRNVLLTAAKP
jgi:SAM-dependent methyltransferase